MKTAFFRGAVILTSCFLEHFPVCRISLWRTFGCVIQKACHMIRPISAAMALLAVSSIATANAETDFYVHGGVNSTTVTQTLQRNTGTNIPTSEETGPANGGSFTTSNQDTGASFYIAGGVEFDVFEDSFVAIEVFYADETAETININSVLVNEVSLNSSYGADVKLGQNVTDKFAIYGLLGVAQFDFDSDVSYTFAPPTDDAGTEEAAFVYGGGVELSLSERISVVTDIRIANDVSFDTPIDRAGVRSENELDFVTIRSGLKYRF